MKGKGWFKMAKIKWVQKRIYAFEVDDGIRITYCNGSWTCHDRSIFDFETKQWFDYLIKIGKVKAFWLCWSKKLNNELDFEWTYKKQFN